MNSPPVPQAVSIPREAAPPWERHRGFYGLLLVAAIAAGLGSRSTWGRSLPDFLRAYAGDTLWALALFLALALFCRHARTGRLALLTLLLAWGVEFSQLYQAEWINQLRHNRLGGLVLGFGFLPSDLLCYTVGVGLAAGLDRALTRGMAGTRWGRG